jgi:hypothetical protein
MTRRVEWLLGDLSSLIVRYVHTLCLEEEQFIGETEENPRAISGSWASFSLLAPFGWADKPAEKHCWLICCERKILFWLKKQAEKDGL